MSLSVLNFHNEPAGEILILPGFTVKFIGPTIKKGDFQNTMSAEAEVLLFPLHHHAHKKLAYVIHFRIASILQVILFVEKFVGYRNATKVNELVQ